MSQSHKSALEAAPVTDPTPVAIPPVSEGPPDAAATVEAGTATTMPGRSRGGSAFSDTFWLCLFLTFPAIAFSQEAQLLFGIEVSGFRGSQYLPAVFGLAVVVLGGRVFLRGALTEARARRIGIMTLASVAISIGFAYSLAVTFGLQGRDFWWQLCSLITIMLLANWIQSSLISGFRQMRGELARLLPREAGVVVGEDVIPVPTRQLEHGDLVLITSGGSVPADGQVVEGETQLDEWAINGISAVSQKCVGDHVAAGSRVVAGAATVRVTRSGDETELAVAAKLVDELQSSTSSRQAGAESAASRLGLFALPAAGFTAAAWLILVPGDPTFAVERMLAVLLVASPPAVRLAIPLVVWASTRTAVRRGLLMGSRRALDEARHTQLVLFDKTGTLTEGSLTVRDVLTTGGLAENELLAIAAAVERKCDHPIAHAIVAEGTARKLRRGRPSRFVTLNGRGAKATLDKRDVTVASARVAIERGMIIDASLVRAAHEAAAEGSTVVYVLTDTEVLGMIALTDAVRPEAMDAVLSLNSHGIRCAVLTGDSRDAAHYVGDQLGIGEVFAELLPEEKARVVERLQHEGVVVAAVGDAANDAEALKQADFAIAIHPGNGSPPLESADVVLPTSDPRGAVEAVELSRAVHRKCTQNLNWAIAYHLVAIPLAAGLAGAGGILVAPVLAAALPVVAVGFVALNSLALKSPVVAARGSTSP